MAIAQYRAGDMKNDRAVCTTCGSQYTTESAPDRCIICDEERQYVRPNGQQWTTAAGVLKDHKNTWTDIETGVVAIGVEPKFGIGQHGYLIRTGKHLRLQTLHADVPVRLQQQATCQLNQHMYTQAARR